MKQGNALREFVAAVPVFDVARFDAEARRLVLDLHEPQPLTYWLDFGTTVACGWLGLVGAVVLAFGSPGMIGAAAVAVFAFYRALCFMHEITHVRTGALRGFETVWNVLVGVPMLMPSTVYVGVHQDHHKTSAYATADDPEYLPFARSRRLTVGFALQSLLIPVLLVIRFVLLVPFELVIPQLHRLLAERASALAMNPRYRRVVGPAMSRKMRLVHTATCAVWVLALMFVYRGAIPWRAFGVWYLVTAVASFINTLRTLAAHQYDGTGQTMSRREQLLDSIDIPGAPWTELWAPVGLRYHALHHYFPGIPYHNLPAAYRRLVTGLQEYALSTREGLVPTLAELYRKGAAAEKS
jgi:fatty acid desaturase